MVVSTVASQREGSRFDPQLGPFCVEFACSPCVCVGSLRVLRLPPIFYTTSLVLSEIDVFVLVLLLFSLNNNASLRMHHWSVNIHRVQLIHQELCQTCWIAPCVRVRLARKSGPNQTVREEKKNRKHTVTPSVVGGAEKHEDLLQTLQTQEPPQTETASSLKNTEWCLIWWTLI